mmetsp:Transcript_32701/g.33346  ORF Transcript_32701/g.33346 Transcript_32701/m.33346 type:complete len:586 (+) Transcript_32701:156-1913(+)
MTHSPKLTKEEMRKARLRAMGQTVEEEDQKSLEESKLGVETEAVLSNISPSWELDEGSSSKLFSIIAARDLPRDDLSRWFKQGFLFCESPSFGLRQGQGGPCGVLAAVQAELIREIIFCALHPNGLIDLPNSIAADELSMYFSKALTAILWRSSPNKVIRIVEANELNLNLSPAANQLNPFLGLKVWEFSSPDTCEQFLRKHRDMFQSVSGCMVFLLSLLLTRGIETVRNDMDDAESSLLGQYGHCTQELVNLLLTGSAVSNVFDGDMSTGGTGGYSCKGIRHRSTVGYLSHLEALRYLQVGSFYKVPSEPVWVIGSSSHFSVLFSTTRNVNEATSEEELLSKMRRAFKALDVEETGFIPAEKFNQLLEDVDAMRLVTSVPVYRKLAQDLQLDTTSRFNDGIESVDISGIILWSVFWEHVSKLLAGHSGSSTSLTNSSPSYPSQGRFRSDSDMARELQAQWNAEGDLPLTPMASSPMSSRGTETETEAGRGSIHRHDSIADENAEGFTMYHFNGLEGYMHRAARLCPFTLYRRATVSYIGKSGVPLDEGVLTASHTGSEPLEEILRTRWQGCRIDWRGVPPPSID